MSLTQRATTAILIASVAFGLGGLCMARAEGFSRPVPACGALALFLVGASAMMIAVQHGELSAAYVVGLGLEAVVSVVLGVAVLREPLSLGKLAGLVTIVAGIVLIKR